MRVLAFAIISLLIAAACRRDETPSFPPDDVDLTVIDNILITKTPPNRWHHTGVKAPDEGCEKLTLRWTGSLKKEFNDINDVHIQAAEALGFPPITSESDILKLPRPVVKVVSCADFYVEDLTHSFPYLVPEAYDLLHEIGHRFNDTLQARGGGKYRIKVTSLLRTPATVTRLSEKNPNASRNSAHSFGTTFDISYSKFICDNSSDTRRTFEDLKNLLGEILHDLRNEGRCYVKYEVKQSCFHITTRPLKSNHP